MKSISHRYFRTSIFCEFSLICSTYSRYSFRIFIFVVLAISSVEFLLSDTMQVVIMATSQVLLYQKKSMDFSLELLLPIKRTIPISWSFSISLLISCHNHGDKESRTSNRFLSQRQASDDKPLVSAKN